MVQGLVSISDVWAFGGGTSLAVICSLDFLILGLWEKYDSDIIDALRQHSRVKPRSALKLFAQPHDDSIVSALNRTESDHRCSGSRLYYSLVSWYEEVASPVWLQYVNAIIACGRLERKQNGV